MGRGGQGEGRRTTQPEKWQRWRKEKTKMRKMIRMKKRTCWEKFLEENGQKNPLDVVRMAKNPWGSRERMKVLMDTRGREIPERERGKAMENGHFLWNANRMEEEELLEGPVYSMDKILDKVYKALLGTCNTSARGPDEISDRIQKAANKTRLGEELMIHVAANLVTGSIPKDW